MLRRAQKLVLIVAAVLTAACVWWLVQAARHDSFAGRSTADFTAVEGRPGPISAHEQSHPAASAAVDEHEVRALHQALEKKPDHAPILIRLAVLAESKGQNKEAIGYLKEALQNDAANVEARLELGRALFNSGDLQGAMDATQKVLDKQPKNPDALYNLGAIYGNLGNREMAEKYWRTLLTASPESESGKLARASLAQLTSSSSARSF